MNVDGINSETWLQHAWRNQVQSLLLLAVMAAFLVLLGWLLWGSYGILILLVIGAIGVLFNPAISPRLVMRLYRASPIGPRQIPGLWFALTRLAERAGLPRVPELYYIPSRMLNAFAVGTREQSAIAVTDGLLRRLNQRELLGVLAHEVSHVRSNDLWVMGLADLFSRATGLLSLLGQMLLLFSLPLLLFSDLSVNWFAILLLIFAPSLSALAQLALSRTREYDADLNAVLLTGDSDGLARALVKIEQAQGGLWERIFMPGRRVPDPSLLRTHPDTRDRVERLMALKPPASARIALPVEKNDFDIKPLFGGPVVRPPRWHINGLWH